MMKVGLTGNIGSGKSTVAKVFSALNIPVYHADEEAKKFLDTPEVLARLQATFGSSVINDDRVERKALAEIVFNDDQKLKELNNIIHPLVKDDYKRWCENHKHFSYTLQEAAILVESGFYRLMDKVVVVSAPQETRILRIMERDQATRREVMSRMKKQFSESQLRAHADFVIDNSGSDLVIPQVLVIHDALMKSGR